MRFGNLRAFQSEPMEPISMQRSRSGSLLWILFISLSISTHAQSGPPESLSKIVEKNLPFPFPIQWTTSGVEISLIHVAWGPADSPEIQSKGRPKMVQERPTFYPDRPYVLALGFQAKLIGVIPTISYTSSGLVRIKDTDGNIELPMVLTADGFVPFSGSPGVYDVHFDKNTTTEYWDLFPAGTDQKEFLFQVFPGNARAHDPSVFFRMVLRDGDIAIVDVSSQPRTCLDSQNDFAGTIGASARVKVHLVGNSAGLSGTEQYERIGKTLWLRGQADALGNVVLEERYPEDRVTAIFKGKFSNRCQLMQGYFSKPDGSRLLPFEFRQMHSAGTQQVPDQNESQN